MAKAKGKVIRDELTPEGRRFFAEIESLVRQQVRVGFQQGEVQTGDGVDLVDIATFNEVGTAHIPARPFLRNSVDNNADAINAMCKAQLQNVVRGGKAEQALNAIGEMQVGLVKDTISRSKEWAEPNAESTIAKKKGGDVPLVDTGLMSQSVRKVIVPKD